jgi:hypothetical protein
MDGSGASSLENRVQLSPARPARHDLAVIPGDVVTSTDIGDHPPSEPSSAWLVIQRTAVPDFEQILQTGRPPRTLESAYAG